MIGQVKETGVAALSSAPQLSNRCDAAFGAAASICQNSRHDGDDEDGDNADDANEDDDDNDDDDDDDEQSWQ